MRFSILDPWIKWKIIDSTISALSFGFLTIMFYKYREIREIFGMFTLLSILAVIIFIVLAKWKRRK